VLKVRRGGEKMRLARRYERGQSLVLLALSAVALMGAGALALDAFNIYWNHNRLQTATDAAALAGAIYLGNVSLSGINAGCNYGTTAQNAACTYALANGIASGEISGITADTTNMTVTVSASRKIAAWLARAVGISQFTVSTTSVAALRALNSGWEALPIGLSSATPYTYGEAIVMHTPGTVCGSGCWQGLALNGTGGDNFRQNLASGCQCTLTVGETVTSEPGAKVGPTQQGIADRLDSPNIDPSGTWQSHAPDDPRAVLIPLVDWGGCIGSGGRTCQAVIEGFAEVWITGTDGSNIDGVFIRQVDTGTAGPPGTNTGAVHALLIQ
jgi:Flp pilus assembly protein TadG